MKRGLDQPPLTEMEGILAGQQPFAEDPFGALQPAALMKVLIVRDEHVPDHRRIARDEEMLAAHP